ncbi:hypothetical protein L210DRAFT_3609687 [Boletus edulis BED1]|uniref:CxC2-like cysteine cluster KDZ transposase-associated domain-containing protein n=1 Tax=Boletus edulis BED1 TaxID=1328754 RepID=A0AAD4C5Y2_BOLED|nr:hypothetical protein L210DRAFT_3609687 [Boletus edulis BED1]
MHCDESTTPSSSGQNASLLHFDDSDRVAGRPVTDVKFKSFKGFKIHQRQGVPTTALGSVGRHTKISSDDTGKLHLTKKLYKAPNAKRRTLLTQVTSPTRSFIFDPFNLPECVDNLPDTVDLGILNHVARERTATTCTICKSRPARYWCHNCLTLDLYCKECLLSSHASQPLHNVKEWQGSYWARTSLKEVGLVIQLSHPSGMPCVLPKTPYGDDFVIIDGNGIHSVTLRLCGCETAETSPQQLLRFRLFPASTDKPCTAATFSVLEEYHLLALESKVSAHHFYNSLVRRSDNTGLSNNDKDRYEQFMRIAREWRHLKTLKRAGRGHDVRGAAGTKEGECAILCPACPQPGKNLPDNWDKTPKEKEWLYGLFVAIDANFRLKRRAVSKDAVDPSLSGGWSYFVEEQRYKQYLSEHSNTRQEQSTCASHNAVNAADTKVSKGLSATGVGSICCAQHEMKLPGGVGDLQKGERYVNMDYLFFSVLKDTPLKCLNISYDIMCQWSRHLWSRMETMPTSMHFRYEDRKINLFIPKFHLPAHIAKCQWKFSFNFEMGPGHRRDTLDDLIGDSNWKKFIRFGESLLSKLKEAVPERNEHQEDLREFESSLAQQYKEQLAKWKEDVEAWEADMSKPNPFEVRSHFISQASVRLSLAQCDALRIAESSEPPIHPDVSPSVLISTGIDLEDQQRRLRFDMEKLGPHASDHQKRKIVERSNTLIRRMEAWAGIQMLYIPRVASLRSKMVDSDCNNSHLFELWLPSALPILTPCDAGLLEIEWPLRMGQAHDALEELRQALHTCSYMLRFKDRFLRGQGANTRARNSLKIVDAKVDSSAVKYHTAHAALMALSKRLGKTGWDKNLQVLEKDDIRPMTAGTDDRASEGRRRLSWIWLVRGYNEDTTGDNEEQEVQDAIRVEWCKARARAHRWTEEVVLLVEEQRRVLEFLRWQESWWLIKEAEVDTSDLSLKEGLSAYALRQAALKHDLRIHFTRMWQDTQRWDDLQ